jgi:3-hydroxyacyl-[acyl-carrier-protein] dehydratase
METFEKLEKNETFKDRLKVEDFLMQRPPFLFVDEILSFDPDKNVIKTRKYFSGEEDFFKGHFPGFPVIPGVILCEAQFQAASILMGMRQGSNKMKSLGVISKIESCRFKKLLHPPVSLIQETELVEQLGNAYYFKGTTLIQNETGKVLNLQFTCSSLQDREAAWSI